MPETAEAATGPRMTGARMADLLEEEIVIGVRFPRERLVEDELMVRFDGKRHAVRQALQILESRGVVERRPNAGAFVRSFTAKEVRDLYALRDLLEVRAAELIEFPVDPEHLADLEEAQRCHDAAVEANNPRAVVTANMRFHRKLFALSGNEALTEAINRYARVAHAIRSVTVTSVESLHLSRQEHRRMLDALREGDRDLLAATCRAHLIPSRDAYLKRVVPAES
ncbi:GntR family transcriptional regulator [Nocardiopsis dassonvillei]|uniref:GntR family transcriptional regulator n=1 Tax=Nocardiopsis dassonvillei TaxID=2014 RepID=UPI0036FC9996